jgi:small subunit ribosomal protein S1
MDQNDAHNGQETAKEKKQETDTEAEIVSMESLLEQGDLALDLPKPGDVIQGMIASISENEILVSVGAKSEGLIPSRELEQIPEEERAQFEVGQEITVYVISPADRRGTLLLSFNRALEESDWDKALHLLDSKEAYESEISGYNKGGLIVNLGRLRGFVPASHVSVSRRMAYSGDTPEQRWSGMVGEPIITRVIEVDRERRRLILSERAASQESREALKEKLLEELEEGETRTGRVTSLADFGAFVNINGADGLVHLSEISWERIEHPSEVLKVGQEVEVRVISVDHERKRIGLSIRQLEHDPWADRIEEYKEGQLIEGQITRLTKFGAFARIAEDMEGLIHISELSDRRIEHPKEVLAEGDTVTLRIIKIDKSRRRIGLSLREVDSGKYSDVDWEMTLAEIDELADPEEEAEPVEESPIAEEEQHLPAEAAVDEAAEEPALEEDQPDGEDEGAEPVMALEDDPAEEPEMEETAGDVQEDQQDAAGEEEETAQSSEEDIEEQPESETEE